MKSDEELERRGSPYIVAVTMFFGAITGGSVLLFAWQQVVALVFINWGTGARNIAGVLNTVLSDTPSFLVSYFVFTFPYLAMGALAHSISIVFLGRSAFGVCVIIAVLSSIPAFWSVFRLIPAGHIVGVPGGFAITVWITLEFLKWLVTWGLVWYFTNAFVGLHKR